MSIANPTWAGATAPTVSFDDPHLRNGNIYGTSHLEATATDDGDIVSVKFTLYEECVPGNPFPPNDLDNFEENVGAQPPPYKFSLDVDLSQYPIGDLSVYAQAQDNDGNWSADPIDCLSFRSVNGGLMPLLFDNDLTNISNQYSEFNNNDDNESEEDDRNYKDENGDIVSTLKPLSNFKINASVSEMSGHGVGIGYKMNAGLGRAPVWHKTDYSGLTVNENLDWFNAQYSSLLVEPEAGIGLGSIMEYVYDDDGPAEPNDQPGDVLQAFMDEADSVGQEDLVPIISVRMNDPHYLKCLHADLEKEDPTHSGTETTCTGSTFRNWMNLFFTQFLYEHHEASIVNGDPVPVADDYFIFSVHADEDGQFDRTLDFTIDAVRNHRLNIIKDIALYSPVAIELNFLRGPYYFSRYGPDENPIDDPKDYDADPLDPEIVRRKGIMMPFLEDIRLGVDAVVADPSNNSNTDIGMIVKGPLRIECLESTSRKRKRVGWDCMGLEIRSPPQVAVGTSVGEFADAIVLTDHFKTPWIYSSDLRRIKDKNPDTPVYIELHFSCGSLQEKIFGNQADRCSREELYQAANWSYETGADGLSLFNFQYFRPRSSEVAANVPELDAMEIPFDILRNLADWRWLRVHTEQTLDTLVEESTLDDPVMRGDFDGDGQTDIAVLVDYSGNLGIHTVVSGNSGLWTHKGFDIMDASWPVELREGPLSVGDFNGDGRDDIVFLIDSGNGTELWTLSATGNGNWDGDGQGIVLSIPYPQLSPFFVAKLDDDGFDDLVFLSDVSGDLGLQSALSNGNGTWDDSPPLQIHPWGNGFYSASGDGGIPQVEHFAVGNFTGDGHTDIVFFTSNDDGELALKLLVAEGDGSWDEYPHETTNLVSNLVDEPSIVDDFNSDSFDDLLFMVPDAATGENLALQMLYSNGDGTWADQGQDEISSLDAELRNQIYIKGDFLGNEGASDILFLSDHFGQVATTLLTLDAGEWALHDNGVPRIEWDAEILGQTMLTGKFDGGSTEDILFVVADNFSVLDRGIGLRDGRTDLTLKQLLSDGEGCWKTWCSEDRDGDGVPDPYDNCPRTQNDQQENGDGDLFGDACDNCTLQPNNDQADSDNDLYGDLCDSNEEYFDEDGVVDANDYVAWADNYGSLQVAFFTNGDFDGDARVDGDDYELWKEDFGKFNGPSAFATPSAIVVELCALEVPFDECYLNPPDVDGDGMDNDFEILYGLDPTDPSDAQEDPDGDFRSNLQEYLDGTNPLVPDHPGLAVPALPMTGYLTLIVLMIGCVQLALSSPRQRSATREAQHHPVH